MTPRAKTISISEERLAEIIRENVREAVRAELFDAGLMLHEPEDRMSARKDFDFVRSMRGRFDTASSWVGKAIVGALITGLIAIVIAGLNAMGFKIGK
jgi:hypothetical protein